MTPHCDHCPVDAGLPCGGTSAGHRGYAVPRLCELARLGNPKHLASIRRDAEKAAGLGRIERPTATSGSDPTTDVTTEGRVLIHGMLTAWTGYGRIAEWLGRSLESIGVPVAYEASGVDPRYHGLPEFVTSRIEHDPPDEWVLRLNVPHADPETRPYVQFSMWESTGLPDVAVERLNQAIAVVVPCSWNASCFSARGVTRPIRIAPLGIDPAEGFTPRPPLTSGPFRFGMAARMSHGGVRKGLREGVSAFQEAFHNDDDVALEVKIFPDCDFPESNDPRITINRTPLTGNGMADWYASIDCLFIPSKGEGWGMHTHEAMSTGRPIIASLFGGTAEFVDRSCAWPLDYTLEPAGEFYSGQGDWVVPTHASMVRALRHVRGLRGSQEYAAKSAASAVRAAEYTWTRTAKALRAALIEAGVLKIAKPAEHPLPGLLAQAANFGAAMVDHAANGFKIASDELQADRLKVCATCEFYRGSDQRCSKCGCGLPAKVELASSYCPVGKWNADDST